jgi:hypothetical protein
MPISHTEIAETQRPLRLRASSSFLTLAGRSRSATPSAYHSQICVSKCVGQKTVGVPFDYKFQGTHMLRLSRLGEFADVFAVTEFDFWIDSSDSPSRA